MLGTSAAVNNAKAAPGPIKIISASISIVLSVLILDILTRDE
jgi:hypothetical protein